MKKIAVDSAQFSKIITHNKIYVDKTKFLYKIATENTYYFLSRPRRFGKTLFIDTLENFFKGNRELFKGLYIYDQKWSWDEYPVIRLDFNSIPHEDRSILEESLRIRFNEIGEYYNLQIRLDKAYYQLSELVKKLSKKYDKGVVVLIDEYDKPIISHLGHESIDQDENKKLQIAKENQEFLKIVYDNIKSLEPYLTKVFITGVTKFSKISIVSTLNNLIEIDQEPTFAEIMGYTENELIHNFFPYLKKLGDYYKISVEEAIAKFRRTYNGFRFTEKEVQVYNPYSSGRALYFSRLDNYWFESGTPTFLIHSIKDRGFDVTNFNHIEIGKDEIKAYDIEKLQLIPLLFQTGYLTIKDVEDEIIYVLGYPNIEVERGFNQNLIKSFSEDRIGTPVIHGIKKSLLCKNYEVFIESMRSLFASISNISIPKALEDREAYYHSIFYLTAVLFSDNNLDVYSEVLTSKGRIDMLVETKDSIFILEFKCNQYARKAIRQIREKNYTERFRMKNKQCILIGINFDTDARNISEFEVELD